MLKGHAGGVTAMALCPVFRETVRDRDHVRGARTSSTNSTNSTNSARGGPSRPSAGASFRVAAGAAAARSRRGRSPRRRPARELVLDAAPGVRRGARARRRARLHVPHRRGGRAGERLGGPPRACGTCRRARSVRARRRARRWVGGVLPDGAFLLAGVADGRSWRGATRRVPRRAFPVTGGKTRPRSPSRSEARDSGRADLLAPPPARGRGGGGGRGGAVGVTRCVAAATLRARGRRAFCVDTRRSPAWCARELRNRGRLRAKSVSAACLCGGVLRDLRAPAVFRRRRTRRHRRDGADWCMPLRAGTRSPRARPRPVARGAGHVSAVPPRS